MSVRTEMLRQIADIAEQYAREHGNGVTVVEFAAHLRDTAQTGEKCIPAGEQPAEDEATHRHPRPCEFPTVLPCCCPRPGALPDASFVRARRRACIGAFFHGTRDGRAAVWSGAAL